MPSYVNIPIETDPDALSELAFDSMESQSPGWTPQDGNIDVWLIIAIAFIAAEVRDLASDVPTTIFRYLGSQIFGIVPLSGSVAVAKTTWTMRDSAGYPIPSATVVGLRNSDGDLVYFETMFDTIVDPGATTAVNVDIASLEETADANGLSGTAELIDALDFVAGVTVTTASAGGTDDEDDDTYLDRLTREMRLLKRSAVLPEDFAAIARNQAGVYRAVALDGYNPVTDTNNNEKTITVAAMDVTGAALPALVSDALEVYLESLREVNFEVFVRPPTFVGIDVTYEAEAYPGYDILDVKTRADAAVANYLNPLTWGLLDSGDSQVWSDTTTVEEYELATVLNNVQGLKKVTLLTFGLEGGAQSDTTIDLSTAGIAPVAQAATIDGTVV